jgi:hypothetical protein
MLSGRESSQSVGAQNQNGAVELIFCVFEHCVATSKFSRHGFGWPDILSRSRLVSAHLVFSGRIFIVSLPVDLTELACCLAHDTDEDVQ